MGWEKGHKMSEAHKAAISRARKGMKFSEEHRANLSKAITGKRASEETRTKLSVERRLRCNDPMWRQRMSEQTTEQWKDLDIRDSMIAGQQAHFATTEHGNNFPVGTPQSELDFASTLLPAGYVAGYIIPTSRPECNGGGYYRLDYAHVEAKVNIEIDGSSHRFKKDRDKKRDEFLRSLGWKVIRIKV